MHPGQIPSPVRRTTAACQPAVAAHQGVSHRHGAAPKHASPGGVARRVSPLSRAVAAALHHLADLTGAEARAAFVARTRIDQMLREAVDRHPERGDRAGAGAAVRVACAYLVAGDTEDAYLALLTARDMLT